MTDVSSDMLKTAKVAAIAATNSGKYHPDLAMGSFQIGTVQPVLDVNSTPQHLAVPVLQRSSIFGYFTCSLDGAITKFTAFCDTLSEIEACPMAHLWMDQKSIVQTASQHFPTLQNIQQVFLSYDDHKNTLAWRVLGTDPTGTPMAIFVMGLVAYLAS